MSALDTQTLASILVDKATGAALHATKLHMARRMGAGAETCGVYSEAAARHLEDLRSYTDALQDSLRDPALETSAPASQAADGPSAQGAPSLAGTPYGGDPESEGRAA